MPNRLVTGMAVVVTLAATFVILMPSSMVPQSHFAHQDKVEHLCVTGMLGCLWMLAVRQPLQVIMAGIGYGVATELLQLWMGLGRTCDPMDALADAIGAALGTATAMAWLRWRRRRRVSDGAGTV